MTKFLLWLLLLLNWLFRPNQLYAFYNAVYTPLHTIILKVSAVYKVIQFSKYIKITISCRN